MTSTYENAINKIIALFKADGTLNAAVKAWFFGLHDVRKPGTRFPYITVYLIGGPVKPATTGKKQKDMSYGIAVVDRHVKIEKAEKKAMDLQEQAETILDKNRTLDGLVQDSWVSAINTDRVILGDYAIIGIGFTFYTRSFATYS